MSESVKGQTRLFDDVDAMSAAPPIATECCTAVSGASGQQRKYWINPDPATVANVTTLAIAPTDCP